MASQLLNGFKFYQICLIIWMWGWLTWGVAVKDRTATKTCIKLPAVTVRDISSDSPLHWIPCHSSLNGQIDKFMHNWGLYYEKENEGNCVFFFSHWKKDEQKAKSRIGERGWVRGQRLLWSRWLRRKKVIWEFHNKIWCLKCERGAQDNKAYLLGELCRILSHNSNSKMNTPKWLKIIFLLLSLWIINLVTG